MNLERTLASKDRMYEEKDVGSSVDQSNLINGHATPRHKQIECQALGASPPTEAQLRIIMQKLRQVQKNQKASTCDGRSALATFFEI